MSRLEQACTWPPSGLSEEAEAEVSSDVGEVQRNLGLLDQSCGKNFPEEFQNARGTHLEEIDLNHTQPMLGGNQNRLWARIRGLTSPEEATLS